MSVGEYLLALGVLAIGCGVQSTLGIGAALVAGPTLMTIDSALLPGPMLVMAMIVNVRNAVGDRASTDVGAWKRAVLGSPLGLAAGIVVLALLEQGTLAIVVSSFVLGAVALQLVGLRPPGGAVSHYLAGAATAFSSTVAALPGPMFVIFHGHRDPGTVRGTMAAFMLVATPTILTVLALNGQFGLRHLTLAAVLCPGMFLGLALGRVLRPLIKGHWFRVVILAVASSSAALVLVREIAF
ncbi:MAG: TSUP family transporter [Actinomycetota bacterium]|nr:TSUP family transporter [Actinomycetota bacterium]